MAVKYYCPKCGRRFVDWGAEKLGYKCPSETCDGEDLILPGTESAETLDASQKAKRAKKRKAILPVVSSDIDLPEMEDDFSEGVDLDMDEDVDEDEDEDEDIGPVVADAEGSDEAGDEDVSDDDSDVDDEEEDDADFRDSVDLDEDEVEEEEE